MAPTRRGLLAAAGLAATAGCANVLGGGSDSPLRDRQIADISETVRLGAGEYWAHQFTFDAQSVLLYSAVASDNVDVLLLPRESFETYVADSEDDDTADELQFVNELSDLDTSATAKGSAVTSGEPALVVDNTTWARASPVEEVRVDIDVDAFVRPERFRGESPSDRPAEGNRSATNQSSA